MRAIGAAGVTCLALVLAAAGRASPAGAEPGGAAAPLAGPIQPGAVAISGRLDLTSQSIGRPNTDPTAGSWTGAIGLSARWYPRPWLGFGGEVLGWGFAEVPADFGAVDLQVGPRVELLQPIGGWAAVTLTGILLSGHVRGGDHAATYAAVRYGAGLDLFPVPDLSLDLLLLRVEPVRGLAYQERLAWQLGLSFTVYFRNGPAPPGP